MASSTSIPTPPTTPQYLDLELRREAPYRPRWMLVVFSALVLVIAVAVLAFMLGRMLAS